MGDIAGTMRSVGGRNRLHQLPPREVRHADVPNLALRDEHVELFQDLVDRGLRIVGMQLEQIDAVGPQPTQRLLDRIDQARPGRSRIRLPVADRKPRLRRDQHLVTPAHEGVSEHLLRGAIGVDVGGVEQCDTSVQADVNDAPGLVDVRVAPRAEEVARPPNVAAPKLNSDTTSPDVPTRRYSMPTLKETVFPIMQRSTMIALMKLASLQAVCLSFVFNS
ncbi:MAG: hypothetical protein QOF25_3273 [Mycobacterium sp.]|jgi:hypothetical protein|nr:hypothetical protein [Mycobacterium sp.]